jgi:hypothetical protein
MRAMSVCVLAALVWLGAPRTADAQQRPDDVGRARELFVQAGELRDHGELRGALAKFEAAHVLAVNPITTFELARTYATLGMLVEARDAYASIARLPPQADETERASEARRDGPMAADELRRRIPTLSIKIAVPADALSVTLDDQPVPAASLVEPRAVDPGTHHLVATGAGGARAEQTITVSEGESREVKLGVMPAAAPTPAAGLEPKAWAPPPAPDARGNHLGPFAYAGFGVGATGFVVGTILAGATLSKASSISVDCGTTACVQGAKDATHSARDLGTAAVVSYTLAAAGVGVGVADILLYKPGPSATASEHALRAWIGVGAAGLRGSF